MYKEWTANGAWFDVVGPKVRLLSASQQSPSEFSVLEARLAPGVFVPLHSHEDREAFYVVSGKAEAYVNGAWQELCAGELIDIAPDKMHAWRNSSTQDTHLVLITTEKMRMFFETIARPLDAGIPSAADMAALVQASQKYGYRLGSPADNASIGLTLG
ncbi:cupin domain-containing protein [Rhizobium sp. AB2/73]|uniref:cupin domain-containing protein n=1 Tax=Rhizobium sp. AB2/73 TaxID=2795216 RepID=UPI0013AEFF98|nr:cupin domain-containing protein [Rhizobium sp. AB2/73]QYA17446.1 cupin domain-containing protein [Rhizobium sp. AB2/73]UEQ85767.1 cupin domain-containing protein [Rhizobium sp. AB2/73]